uniref:Si:ch73-141c7.1 n=1 Tax=Neogobius melanostomus TaxID=47308 RepID=A0A8C6SPT7_9GOBI
MTARTNPRLLKTLLVFSETYFSRHSRRAAQQQVRHVGSCGTLLCSRTSAPAPVSPTVTPSRRLINPAASISPRKIEHSECKTLQYTPEQMYDIVADVDRYSHFIPWCKKSRMMKSRNGEARAELEIGFPPLLERYVSELTYVPNHQVRAVCREGTLFRHLETVWSFSPGPAPNSCNVELHVSFEFKSLFHSHLAGVLFEEAAKEMIAAFESRAATLYRNRPAVSLKKPS